MNELINAIRYDKTNGFREKYRSVDVLLMMNVSSWLERSALRKSSSYI